MLRGVTRFISFDSNVFIISTRDESHAMVHEYSPCVRFMADTSECGASREWPRYHINSESIIYTIDTIITSSLVPVYGHKHETTVTRPTLDLFDDLYV